MLFIGLELHNQISRESMFDLAQIIPGPGYPKDVANLVLFLVSENSRFITSEIINIDGGVAAKI